MATTHKAQESTERRGALAVETHGIDVIPDAERKGRPRQLFWPWFGANARHRPVFPALRVHRAGRQARVGPDDGAQPGRVRRAGQPGAVDAVVASHRRLGDRADHPRDAGHRDCLRPVGLEFGQCHQDRRAARGRGVDNHRRRDGLRADHADAGGDHGRHRRAHNRLHRPRRRQDRLARVVERAVRIGAAGRRLLRAVLHRLRYRLGECRG